MGERIPYYEMEGRGGACEQGGDEYVIGTHGPESAPPERGMQGFAKVDWVTVWIPALLETRSGQGVVG